MSKPEVYLFPGSPADVVVTLTHLTEELDAGFTNDAQEAKVTEFHMNSTVLKEQSKYFEAHILRWSQTTPSAQPATPWRGTLKCINGVGASSYAKCFRAMYEAHFGESAQILAQRAVKGVEDALVFLRVAANLGFSVGVDAALSRIESVPWTTDEDASISECINSLQLPVPSSLAARLQDYGPGTSIVLSRNVLREGLVERWKASLLDWKTVGKTMGPGTSHGRGWEQVRFEVRRLLDIVCNTMFQVFGKAVHLGVADELVLSFVEDKDLKSLWTNALRYELLACYEAVLLVFLRIMQALSRGEVVCRESIRQDVVFQCLDALTILNSSVAHHFRPGSNSETLQMCEHQSVLPSSTST